MGKIIKSILMVVAFIFICIAAPVLFSAVASVIALLGAFAPFIGVLLIILLPGILIGIVIKR